tara:strand:- start:111 stop:347 length:237 start_codon:yes stop_codon:yes gene_type:complete
MSIFIQAMKDSGIIQKLRAGLSEADKLKFDKAVEEKLKEYNSMWQETQPLINEYQEKVNKHVDQSEGEQGHDVESNDE